MYQVFSSFCTADIGHRKHFFHLNQSNKSSESKVYIRQASNRFKSVLEAAKHTYANKTIHESITFQ